MKRIHIGTYVDDLEQAIDFYSRLFGEPPSLKRPGYAKWMLDDPRVNFSIDTHDGPPGAAHYGIQVDSRDELDTARAQIDAVGLAREDQDDLVCGYQLQHKSWVRAPHDVMWETFYTEGLVDDADYGDPSMPAFDKSEDSSR